MNDENKTPMNDDSSDIEETSSIRRQEDQPSPEETMPIERSEDAKEVDGADADLEPDDPDTPSYLEETGPLEPGVSLRAKAAAEVEREAVISPYEKKRKRKRRRQSILLGAVIILVGLAAGGGIGYASAIQRRVKEHESQVALITATQYQLGLQDITDGRYEMARKRFEYVIRLDPHFPGAADSLANVMLEMAMEGEEVIVPTSPAATLAPEITPTPDNRGEDELFTHAQMLMQSESWVAAIETLESLRKANLDYRAVEVDGMYYIALRNRGMDKIIKEGNLEGGIYDLTLMERFGPIDKEADNFRTWARQYLTGASFWEVDWGQVVSYFSQVYPSLPNLRDGSNMTATERYRIASRRYGEQLIQAEEWCEAEIHIANALSLSSDPYFEPTATQVALECRPPEDGEVEETPEP